MNTFIGFIKTFTGLISRGWQVTGLGQPVNPAQPKLVNAPGHRRLVAGAWLKAPMVCLAATVVSAGFCIFGHRAWELAGLSGLVVWPALAVMHFELSGATWAAWCAPVRTVVDGRLGVSPARMNSIKNSADQFPTQDHHLE